MADSELLTAEDVRLMQDMAQRVTAIRPDLVNSDAAYGELAWNWGRGHARAGDAWRRRLWHDDAGELVAWAWAALPRRVVLSDGSATEVKGAYLTYQVDPGHSALVDEVIDWFDTVAAGLERTVVPTTDPFALERWAARGYGTDPEALGDQGSWTQLNKRDLGDLEQPVLPAGFRFRTADEAGPRAVVQAHLDAWGPRAYDVEAYESVRRTAPYRGDLHVLVEAPDGTMAASAIMWLDEVNATAEFEPVGTHKGHRRRGLGRALLLHGMHRARAAGARHMTVACLGAPGHPAARELYYGVGFRKFTVDAPLLKPAGH
ncbi:GNAT family N-acetyltransferase [Streptomyces sp. NPDC050145]|uniref:GNAT family N-acetyltransferase n=1 Tax=Streptomyces sp. NPDC050145 TaxID=3365602 RepID=UPI003789FE83